MSASKSINLTSFPNPDYSFEAIVPEQTIPVGTGGAGLATPGPCYLTKTGTVFKITGSYSFFQEDGAVTISFPTANIASVDCVIITRNNVGNTYIIAAVATADGFTIDRENTINGDSPFSFTIYGSLL